jgi:hypothetical protein
MRRLLGPPLVLAALLLLAQPAAAHGDEAVLAVEAQEPSALGVHLEVSARYTNDDELVEAATITATATGPGGETVGPTPLTAVPDTEGLYAADLAFPVGGAWTVQVDATEPVGALTVPVDVVQATTTTAEQTTTTAAQDGAQPDDAESDSSDSSSNVAPVVIGGVVLVAVAAGAVVLVRRRRTGV